MQTYLQSPTPNLTASKEFYEKLNFQAFEHEGHPYYTDGHSKILINPDRSARAALVLEVDDVNKYKTNLSAKGLHFEESKDELLLTCPSGIYTRIKRLSGTLPVGSDQASVLGNAAGLTIESNNMQASADFYEALGFKITTGTAASGWVVMENEIGFSFSLLKSGMCPHLFFNPSISYFNGKEGNPKVIENIRKAGIPFTEEITHFNDQGIVDNVIVRDPGGLGFFVFND